MKIALAAFRGEMPIIDPRLLPDEVAQVSRNSYLRHGTLKPERAPAEVSSIAYTFQPSSLYRYPHGNDGAGFWFVWGGSKLVNVVKSPLADDSFSRVYWTGDGYPKMGSISDVTQGTPPYPSSSYALGVPAPSNAPSVKAPTGRVGKDDYPLTAMQTSYVFTQITRFGEEGPPSNPSLPIIRWDMVEGAPDGGDVMVTLPAISSGNSDIVSIRLYRSELSGVFQEVATLPAGTTSYTDNVGSESLGVSVPSVEWDGPDTRMTGLTAMAAGFMAGFFGSTLCFSEPFMPHAWPVSYQHAFTDDIVGIVSVTNGLIVATEGKPIIMHGASPESMSAMQLDADEPCLSRRSLVDMGEYAIYASHNGLVALGGSEATVATAQVISKAQWKELNPSSIHAYRYEGRYLAFYDGGCFVFTPGEGIEFLDITAQGGYYDIADDTLYLIQGTKITSWGSGDPMMLRWRSKVYEVQEGTAFNCGRIAAYGYPVDLKIYADGELFHLQSVPSRAWFRLPSGLARDWEIEVQSSNEITSIQIAESPDELV